MGTKKKATPFTETDLKNNGYVEVTNNVFIKSTSPIKEIVSNMEVPVQEKKSRIGKYGVADKEDRTFLNRTYDSKIEMQYAKHLLRMVGLKQIKYFNEQVAFQIEFNGVEICRYVCDFVVYYGDGKIEYVDVKGMKTGSAYQIFKLKKKLVEAQYGIKIKEIYKGMF